MNKKLKVILTSVLAIGILLSVAPIATINAYAIVKPHTAVPEVGKLKWVKEDGTFATNQWVYKEKTLKTGGYESGWMYFGANGVAQNGWFNVGGKWYYAKEKLDHESHEEDTYYILTNTWAPNENKNYVYHVDKDGARQTGWVKDTDGYWYYFDQQGKMVKNTIADGCKIDMLGHWVEPVKY